MKSPCPAPLLIALLSLGLAVPLLGAASAEGPLPGHTGGFGEPTCAACHQGPGPADARVRLTDVPAAWQRLATYRITVEVNAAALRRGGFQLAARWATGPAEGRQAGRFEVAGPGARVTESGGIAYVHHTYEGTSASEPGRVVWTVDWRSPTEGIGAIWFHVAANAANDDNSEFGDSIVTAERQVPPAFPSASRSRARGSETR